MCDKRFAAKKQNTGNGLTRVDVCMRPGLSLIFFARANAVVAAGVCSKAHLRRLASTYAGRPLSKVYYISKSCMVSIEDRTSFYELLMSLWLIKARKAP